MLVRTLTQMALSSLPTCLALSPLSKASTSSSSPVISAPGGQILNARLLAALSASAHALSSLTFTTSGKAQDSAVSYCSSGLLGRRLLLGGLVVGTETAFCSFNGTRGKAFASAAVKGKSIHDFIVKDISGNDVDLSVYKGKVLLVVNVASQCGLTMGNYRELTELHKKYSDQGFEILAFPCNQFGGQEPGTNEQIKEFVCSRYKAEFPIFDKVDVNGPRTSPVYAFLKASKGGILGDDIKWNFGKFLVDKNGHVVERYAPTHSPLQIESDIKKLLTA